MKGRLVVNNKLIWLKEKESRIISIEDVLAVQDLDKMSRPENQIEHWKVIELLEILKEEDLMVLWEGWSCWETCWKKSIDLEKKVKRIEHYLARIKELKLKLGKYGKGFPKKDG